LLKEIINNKRFLTYLKKKFLYKFFKNIFNQILKKYLIQIKINLLNKFIKIFRKEYFKKFLKSFNQKNLLNKYSNHHYKKKIFKLFIKSTYKKLAKKIFKKIKKDIIIILIKKIFKDKLFKNLKKKEKVIKKYIKKLSKSKSKKKFFKSLLKIERFIKNKKFIKKISKFLKNEGNLYNIYKKNNLSHLSRLSKLNKFYSLSEYHLPIINKFINQLMKNGKKSIAEKIFYNVINYIAIKNNKNPLLIIKKAIKYSKPLVELRAYRKRGRTLQIPQPIKIFRQSFLGIKWILDFSKENKKNQIIKNLSEELINSARKKGKTQNKIMNLYKTVKENLIYLRIRKKKKYINPRIFVKRSKKKYTQSNSKSNFNNINHNNPNKKYINHNNPNKKYINPNKSNFNNINHNKFNFNNTNRNKFNFNNTNYNKPDKNINTSTYLKNNNKLNQINTKNLKNLNLKKKKKIMNKKSNNIILNKKDNLIYTYFNKKYEMAKIYNEIIYKHRSLRRSFRYFFKTNRRKLNMIKFISSPRKIILWHLERKVEENFKNILEKKYEKTKNIIKIKKNIKKHNKKKK
jgi:small subunit ribosomal protein S7